MNSTTDLSDVIETFLDYVQTLYYRGPQIRRRYYRLFGDLEYDLRSLATELALLRRRIREVQYRMARNVEVTEEDERQISSDAFEASAHLYRRLESFQSVLVEARGFRPNAGRERHARLLLADVATAVMGVDDAHERLEQNRLLVAGCEAYGRLDVIELTDLHERVQPLLALERRLDAPPEEVRLWVERREAIEQSHPLRHAGMLDDPAAIDRHLRELRRRVARRESQLEWYGAIYTGLIATQRYRN